ncbi:MAG: PAS domain-containing sensor histidine kinase [Bacteroidia bacterium]
MKGDSKVVEKNASEILGRVSDAIVALDKEWRYVYLNDAALPNHPGGREGTLGRIIWDVHPDLTGTIFETKYREAMKTGVVAEVESYYAPMELWFAVKIYPDKEGLTIIYKDVTSSRRAEEEVKASRKQLQLIYDSVSDPIFLLDVLPGEKYKFVSVNKAFSAATGIPAEAILNKLANDVIPQSSLQMVLGNYKKAIENKALVEWEETTTYPTGVKIGIVTISPISDSEGKCVQLLGVVHDITERKNAEKSVFFMNEQLRNFSAHLQHIREEERSKVAREIHDDFGQQLTGLKFVLTALKNKNARENHSPEIEKQVAEMINMVDNSITSVRRIAKELRPGILDDLGLEAAIEWQAKEYEDRTGLKIVFNSKINNLRFSKDVNTAVFRIFQESITNVIRHAAASKVNISLFIESENIVLEVVDNGKGISEEGKNNFSSLGLLGMSERAMYLGGEFNIEKHREGGTIVTVKIPLQQ